MTCWVKNQQCCQEVLQDFAKLQLEEISMNISARRNKIFLLMEEVRRLRIQQRIKGGEKTREEEVICHSVFPVLAVVSLCARGKQTRVILSWVILSWVACPQSWMTDCRLAVPAPKILDILIEHAGSATATQVFQNRAVFVSVQQPECYR